MAMLTAMARKMPAENLWILEPSRDRLTYPFCVNQMLDAMFAREQDEGRLADWFFWLEDDILPETDTFDVLRAADKDYVAALTYCSTDPYLPGIATLIEEKGLRTRQQWATAPHAGTHAADHVGMTAALFRRDVFDRVEKPWFGVVADSERMPCGLGPDVFWCRRLAQHGIQPYVCCDAEVGHLAHNRVVDRRISEIYNRKPKDMPITHVKDKQVIIGLGTGRCGTRSLTTVLNVQESTNITHESQPHLRWERNERGGRDRLHRLLSRDSSFVGDVAFYHLPYVAQFRKLCPGVKFVCLRRDRDDCIRSLVNKMLRTELNIFQDHDGTKWKMNMETGAQVPKYNDEPTMEAAIARYYDEYYIWAEKCVGDDFQIFDTDDLNSHEGVQSILEFCGFYEPKVLVGVRENVFQLV